MRPPRGRKPPGAFHNISVVLVETREPGNIGSVARAMKNMGLTRLKLVNPHRYPHRECLKMATQAADVVAAARVYGVFDEAVAEENVLVGTTSARDRKPRQRFYTAREIAPLVHNYAQSRRVALVFGPEARGLTDAQLARCQYLVSIPANPEHPVLNVAQGVMVLAYEIFTAGGAGFDEPLDLAPQGEREEMFAHMEEVLIDIGFLSSHNPEAIMRSIRRFLGKADLTSRDIQILRGMLSQMQWYAREGHRLPAEKVRKL